MKNTSIARVMQADDLLAQAQESSAVKGKALKPLTEFCLYRFAAFASGSSKAMHRGTEQQVSGKQIGLNLIVTSNLPFLLWTLTWLCFQHRVLAAWTCTNYLQAFHSNNGGSCCTIIHWFAEGAINFWKSDSDKKIMEWGTLRVFKISPAKCKSVQNRLCLALLSGESLYRLSSLKMPPSSLESCSSLGTCDSLHGYVHVHSCSKSFTENKKKCQEHNEWERWERSLWLYLNSYFFLLGRFREKVEYIKFSSIKSFYLFSGAM